MGDLVCEGGCVPNDVHNCGACGHDCTDLPQVSGTVTCASGVCSFPQSACAAGWAHCSADPYQCGSACAPGTTPCGTAGSCVDTTSNPSDCKTCGNVCMTSVGHALATCV